MVFRTMLQPNEPPGPFAYFFKLGYLLLSSLFAEVLYIFWMLDPSQDLQTSSPFCRLSFHFLNRGLWCTYAFYLDEIQFVYIFSFVDCTFCVIQSHKFLSLFSSRSFIILAFIFKLLTHFKLILYIVWWIQCISLYVLCPSTLESLWDSCWKSANHGHMDLFLDSQFYSTD